MTSTPAQHADDSVEVVHAARLLADEAAILLDVREHDEWQAGHSTEARHTPLGALDPATLPGDRIIIVVCRSGNRSAQATTLLRAAGLPARNLVGGMKAWAAAGLPVTTAGGRPGRII